MKIRTENGIEEMRPFWFKDNKLFLIDQRKLPLEFEIFEARTLDSIVYVISQMVVRGAPAIGITAAYGYVLGRMGGREHTFDVLLNTRPTAYDLKYALDHMVKAEEDGKDLLMAAREYEEMIISKCKKIGENGADLIKDDMTLLTHCNAGALATGDWGTALAPMRVAWERGTKFSVLVDETRPRLQGARLTAWELLNEGIPHHLIADNAAGHYMSTGQVDLVIVGADRICRNGDFANKIGTYEKAVVAKENGIPFYVAAPVSTIDRSLSSGKDIPIEERSQDEVTNFRSERITTLETPAKNPAFDVTHARFVTGFITEFGILEANTLLQKL